MHSYYKSKVGKHHTIDRKNGVLHENSNTFNQEAKIYPRLDITTVLYSSYFNKNPLTKYSNYLNQHNYTISLPCIII